LGVAELRGGRDEPDDSDLPARRFPADADDGAGEARPPAEPGPRAEYAVAMQQIVDQQSAGEKQAEQAESSQAEAAPANANQAEAGHADDVQEGIDQEDVNQEDASPVGSGQEDAAQNNAADADETEGDQLDAGQADKDLGDADKTDTGRADATPEGADLGDVGQDDADPADADPADADPADADQAAEPSDGGALKRFEPSRAGLPEVSYDDAAAYIEEHLADRPWLAAVRECSPDVQRVFVALDQGHGHAHIRHDGWVTEEMNERRVRNLEDPAQLDPEKREDHVDGIKTGGDLHRCGFIATRITDPEAFATAVARAIEHPDVQAALDSSAPFSVPVTLRISDVLGEDGHRFCSGWQLEPVNGNMSDAVANRTAWVQGDHSVPEPKARPVETFEGGTVTITFRPNAVGGHKINTIFVNPPNTEVT
jgi:hypothetical protein